MNILAISGSTRQDSLNRKLLNAIRECSIDGLNVDIYNGIGFLPIFNQDLEGHDTPDAVLDFCRAIEKCDGLLISSPEYVRSIPGGLKNAIDWLVSREELIGKPVALAHASHRGDDMLSSLRDVLRTVSDKFSEEIFLRIPLEPASLNTEESVLENPANQENIKQFLAEFTQYIEVG